MTQMPAYSSAAWTADAAPTPNPFPVQSSEISNDVFYTEMVDPVLFGDISAEEGVAIFRELATEKLSDN